uniref:substrate-binding periplasmic protein n=1 Tax=Ningiella ruwaisensis TaxID=2364274 RepID=UPI0010A06B3A|nr:transporter substrate-binding domain-containing protein [Ningiella ruwaisensis]
MKSFLFVVNGIIVFQIFSGNSVQARTNAHVTANHSLSMFIWSNELAPIISTNEPYSKVSEIENYQGIVVDVLKDFMRNESLSLEIHLSSRNRGERDLYNNAFDFSILAPDWVRSPENLIFSQPIYTHREYLYALKPFESDKLEESIKNKRICTRFGYKFYSVQHFFDQQIAKRIDSREEAGAFDMLLRDRCDFVLTNEFVADAIIEKNQLSQIVYRSDFAVDEVDFTFAFHPSKQAYRDTLDTHIRRLHDSGELSAFIVKHRNRIATDGLVLSD